MGMKMAGRRRVPPVLLPAISFAILVAYLYFLLDPVLVLQVKSTGNNRVIYSIPVHPGTKFSIRYIHSVDKTPVWERYSVGADGTITLTATEFKMLGAGFGPFEQSVIFENGWNKVTGINRNLDGFFLRVGQIARHTLFIDDLEVPLWKYTASNERVKFRVLKVSRLSLWRKGEKHDRQTGRTIAYPGTNP